MSTEKITASITSLRAEIAKLSVDDETARARLEGLVAELEQQVREPDSAEQGGLDDSLNDLIEQFEVEHPRITGILNDLMVTLSGMGI